MPAPTTGVDSITTSSNRSVKEVAQRALETLSSQLGDNELALMRLTEYFQNLSKTSRGHQTRHFTLRFKILGDDTERLIRDALDTKMPGLFSSRTDHFKYVTAAEVKEGILWIYLNDSVLCQKLRRDPWQINDLFKNVIKSSKRQVLRQIPETYVLCLPGFRPYQWSSREEKSRLPRDVLEAAVVNNGLRGTIMKVVRTCQLWVMHVDNEQDAKHLARQGEMTLDNRPHVRVK